MTDEEKWWKEDADRVNELAERARRTGRTIDPDEPTPPLLNLDGSLADPAELEP